MRTLGPRDSACTWHPATGALRPRVWPHFSTELPPGFPCSLFPVSSCEARDALMHAKRLTLSRLLLVHCTLRKRQMFFFCIRFVQL